MSEKRIWRDFINCFVPFLIFAILPVSGSKGESRYEIKRTEKFGSDENEQRAKKCRRSDFGFHPDNFDGWIVVDLDSDSLFEEQ